MSDEVRRPGAEILTLIETAADPAAVANRGKVYAKDVAGVTQLFYISDTGVVSQITPISATTQRSMLNDQWEQKNIPAAQAAAAIFSDVSTNFDDVLMPRAGLITAITARMAAALTAGTLTATVTVNGVATTVTVAVIAAAQSAVATFAGVAYAAGDRIGVQVSTNAGFLPADTNDVSVNVEVTI